MTNSLQLKTIDGVVSCIETLVKNQQSKTEQPSALMLTALDAIVSLVEKKGRGDEAIAAALGRVREAYGINKRSKQQTETNE